MFYKNINEPISINLSNNISQYIIEFPKKDLYKLIIHQNDLKNLEFYLIDTEKLSFIGPYNFRDINNKTIITDPLNTKKFILEINGYIIDPDEEDMKKLRIEHGVDDE